MAVSWERSDRWERWEGYFWISPKKFLGIRFIENQPSQPPQPPQHKFTDKINFSKNYSSKKFVLVTTLLY